MYVSHLCLHLPVAIVLVLKDLFQSIFPCIVYVRISCCRHGAKSVQEEEEEEKKAKKAAFGGQGDFVYVCVRMS